MSPANTPVTGIQYPVATDRVTDYPATAQAGATTIDVRLGRLQSGSVQVTATNTTTTNTVVVTYPVGRFSVTPAVSVQTIGTGSWIAYLPVSPTANGFSVAAVNRDGVAGSVTNLVIHWIAVQGNA